MKLKLIAAEIWTIYAPCEADGTTFLEKGELDADEVEKFAAHAEKIVCHPRGPQVIPEDRNHLVDDNERIYSLRIGPSRVLWFYDENRVVMWAHTFKKKTQKMPRRELEAARRVKNDYFAAKTAKKLVILEEEKDG